MKKFWMQRCVVSVLQMYYRIAILRVPLLVKEKGYVFKFSKKKVHCRGHPRNPVKIFREVFQKKMSRSLQFRFQIMLYLS